MNSIKRQARLAGLLYLLGGITAPFGLMYVPRTLVVSGDATATADHVRASETLLRLGIATEVFVSVFFIFVLWALYLLFKGVSQKLAVAMVILLLVSIPVSLFNVLNNIAAMILVSGAGFLSSIEPGQLDALAYLFLQLHGQGILVVSVFWGLWLFPFGMLVIRSGFIPRVLGILLMMAGAGYLAGAFTTLVLPQYTRLVNPVAGILVIAEVPIVFWLLIWGARGPASSAPATS